MVPRHKPTDSNYPRGKFSRKKVLRALSKFPCENYYGPHPPLFFSSHTEPPTAFLKEQTPSKARIHVPLRHCSPLLLDTINTIPSKHDHHPLKDQDPY